MKTKRVLTGINTTGIPHLGNYVGAIRPAIIESKNPDLDSFLFLADLHALIKCHDPKLIHESTLAIAATWLACGLDPEKVVFYRQSDIPEIPELNWILNCVCAKGLMNRAHAYKAAIDANMEANNSDSDHGISMGLFCYPVLMAADILMFNATHVPVGRDQIQHLEMARDIAARFNHRYQEVFTLPEAVVDDNVALLTGTDGRKMSKSYGNTIPLFEPEKKLRKAIMKIVTNSQAPGEPKNPDDSTIFDIYRAFANEAEIAQMRTAYQEGISWGDAKQALFERINTELAEPREKYHALIANPKEIENTLQRGAEKAREESRPLMADIRQKVGIYTL
ncbi:tryptophan--tRNA ligase [Suttonella ornithocola]|uniref:Tryptophan--tRNA ligase n=1 Tax=Suttonella ornithocola TaxID=279832 RepID=A0A380MVF5_9GAMM|nr:tryptophan--tRNA ligase [Suttonella ornithocola]SUO95903.1 Tryptophan--tRNA ligase [Suttonella ornithocola]